MNYFAYSQREFVYKYVVMLSDVDQFQHMSFANYLRLIFLATDALLMPIEDGAFLSQYRLQLKSSRMQFKRQSVAGDAILIKINSSSKCMGSNFALIYTFIAENSGELIGLGHQAFEGQLVKDNMTVILPAAVRNLLKPIEVDEDHLLYKY
jgi:acyl-CoA thioesterase FadM